jgi:3-phosphoshikimate 1-carboxyvinyltransferase
LTEFKSLPGGGTLQGEYNPPGDKSISHRAVMFGALGEGTSRFQNFLEADDCLRTVRAFQALGISILNPAGSGTLSIAGKGLGGLQAPSGELDLGNSGTTMRVLLGILAGQRFQAVLTGDESLRSRPMKRVTRPLKQMGAQIKGPDDANFAPLTIRGGKLKGIDFENTLSSAQVKSALLFAGLYADGRTRLLEKIPSRDHTERFLRAAGAPFRQEGEWLCVEKAPALKPLEARLPGDFSSAAFFIAAAAMTEGSELVVKEVGLNPTRTGLLKLLREMGAAVEEKVVEERLEPGGEVRVKGKRLRGIRIPPETIPSVIDELPVLLVACALAEGESLLSGAAELRVKETDRIRSMALGLNALGGDVKELPDGCIIKGVAGLRGGEVKSFGDHRTAMAFAVASLAARGEITVQDVHCVQTSYPGFFKDFNALRRS